MILEREQNKWVIQIIELWYLMSNEGENKMHERSAILRREREITLAYSY
jgi:hypothetical protein